MKEYEKILIRSETASRIYFLYRDEVNPCKWCYGIAYEERDPWNADRDVVYLRRYEDLDDAILYLSFCLQGTARVEGVILSGCV